ncbi:hypothetical protein D9756_008485 [Leucocoprinus leucothites]|uniref:Uncharacterized protein n=1 Tax=Leucocoprinus leucothites TaxID=201217 RepID=A0A8H5FVM2_9AGAR|nr:hypothetical protein D9756_008485 [Leucoagaricus leucothites]
MQFKSLFYFTSFATLALSSSVDDVLRDLALIKTASDNLNTAITAFPTIPLITSLGAALVGFNLYLAFSGVVAYRSQAIHSTAVSTVTTLNATAGDAQTVPIPISVEDGTRVLDAIDGMKSSVEAALVALTGKRNSFLGFLNFIPGLANLNPVRQDLINLNSSTVTLGNILFSMAPTELQPRASATRSEIFNAFATAIAAFS